MKKYTINETQLKVLSKFLSKNNVSNSKVAPKSVLKSKPSEKPNPGQSKNTAGKSIVNKPKK